MSVKNNEEVSKCPGCEGLWLDAEIIDNIFDLSLEKDDSHAERKLDETVSKNSLREKDYYFYKRPFYENANPDEVVGFE